MSLLQRLLSMNIQLKLITILLTNPPVKLLITTMMRLTIVERTLENFKEEDVTVNSGSPDMMESTVKNAPRTVTGTSMPTMGKEPVSVTLPSKCLTESAFQTVERTKDSLPEEDVTASRDSPDMMESTAKDAPSTDIGTSTPTTEKELVPVTSVSKSKDTNVFLTVDPMKDSPLTEDVTVNKVSSDTLEKNVSRNAPRDHGGMPKRRIASVNGDLNSITAAGPVNPSPTNGDHDRQMHIIVSNSLSFPTSFFSININILLTKSISTIEQKY